MTKDLKMERYLKNIKLLVLVMFIWAGCKVDDPELGPAPTADEVKFSATPDSNNPNIIHFKSQAGSVTRAAWDLGNGQTPAGDTVSGAFAVAGEYTVKLTIYKSGGFASASQTIRIAQTNPAMLNREDYNFLTGGSTAVNGKTWVIEKDFPGHLGVGPSSGDGSDSPIWYQAGPNEKKDLGFYDDEMVFNLNNNFAYAYINHGSSFVNGSNAPGLGGVKGDDYALNYTPATNLTWQITEEGGKKYLSISNQGFVAYYTGSSKYQILALSENELYLRANDAANPGNAWYLRLAPKGYIRPVVAKPLKASDLFDQFEANGNITWVAENIVYKTNFDNPFPKPANTSLKVAYYEKQQGDGGQYGNLQTTLDFRLDLSTRNKFSIKVFMPGVNDYTLVKQQVSVKLQNSLEGGNAWQTQKEVIRQVSVANQWVELEFDFSAFSSEVKYDKIVVQLGGEGHPNPGIFYIDDFKLL